MPIGLKIAQAKFVMKAFNSKGRNEAAPLAILFCFNLLPLLFLFLYM